MGDQTDWERVDVFSDEELTHNAQEDPDNPPLEEDRERREITINQLLEELYQ